MFDFLPKIFIKDYKDFANEKVRTAYGTLASIIGVIINIILFAAKYVVGMMAGSVSIKADAINNISDALSSVITLVGFKIASLPADRKHPYGHARIEYLCSLVVSFIILYIGIDTLKESVTKILNPTEAEISIFAVIALVMSILFKLFMYLFNKNIGKKINSLAMEATAADSISDVIGTGAVLISLGITYITHFNVDGFMGVIVAVLIIINGLKVAKEANDCLLGAAPDKEYVDSIIEYAKSKDEILGLHDIMIHNYGPNMFFASLHAEVDGSKDVFETHDAIDNLEKELHEKFNLHATVHLDPIVVGDVRNDRMKELADGIIREIDDSLTLHDFRMVVGPTHTNIIFDCVVPLECKMPFDEITKKINEKLKSYGEANNETVFAVVNFDRI